MESSTNEMLHHFDIESKFVKADLENLKNSKNGYLTGKCYYASNIQFFIRIYPNGDSEEHRGETWIYLKTCDSEELSADITIFVESAEFVQSVNDANKTYKGFGINCCKTCEFFNFGSKYFVNDEISVKVKGTFKKPLATNSTYPISLEWKIREDDLITKKDDELLRSELISIASFSDVKYFLSINPTEQYDENETNVEVYLNIEMENGKQIKALYDISVNAANCNCVGGFIFERSREYGRPICSTNDLFDPAKKFIMDGFLTINFNGSLTITNIDNLNAKMECLSHKIVCPFDSEWKFQKSDFLAIKDKENAFLRGKYFYAYSIPGLRYRVHVWPDGGCDERRGETWIFLDIQNCSGEQNVYANFNICVESANFSEYMTCDFQKNKVWGETCCKTFEFFKSSKNKFFVNGELTIRIKGVFKTQLSLATTMLYPISMQWKIKEEDLRTKKESNEQLRSKRIDIASFSDIKYFFSIRSNVITSNNSTAKTFIFLNIENEKKLKIKAIYDFGIDSANYNEGLEYIFEKSNGYGLAICSTNKFFDSTQNYIKKDIDIGQHDLNIKRNKSDFANESKEDFTIIVDDNEIPIHKQKLMDASSAFVGMFNSGMKETIENKMVVKGFPYEIVDAAVSIMYDSNVPQNFVLHDLLLLYQFGEKYEIKLIMDHVEESLIKHISPANVCQLEKFSTNFNVLKLHQSCIQYLVKCSKETTPVYGLQSLDRDLVFEMFLSTFCPVVDTDA